MNPSDITKTFEQNRISSKSYPKIKSLDALFNYAKEEFSHYVIGFERSSHMAGSWIAGRPIPLQLLQNPRLTIDLTINELRKPNPFNIPIKSLITLAQENFVYLNFRDYDSQKENNFIDILSDKTASRNLDLLINELGEKRIYLGSEVRRNVFNAALNEYGVEESYETFQHKAWEQFVDIYKILKPHFDKAREYNQLTEYLFRGEMPNLHAVTWHWAYLNSISLFLHDKDANLIGNEAEPGRAYEMYNRARARGKQALDDQNNQNKLRSALYAFLEMAQFLRLCHLNFTAPITASFGTTYNMAMDEYRTSILLGITDEKEQLLIFDDRKFQQFIIRLLNEEGILDINMADFPIEHELTRKISATSVDEIMNILANNPKEISNLHRLKDDLRRSYVEERIGARDIYSDYMEMKKEVNNLYREKLAGDIWHFISPYIGAMSVLDASIQPFIFQIISDQVESWLDIQSRKIFKKKKYIYVLQQIQCEIKALTK